MGTKLNSSYDAYGVIYDLEQDTFEIFAQDNKKCITNARVESILYQGQELDLGMFTKKSYGQRLGDAAVLTVVYRSESKIVPSYTLNFSSSEKGVKVDFIANPECVAKICGTLQWGEQVAEHTFPMSSRENSCVLRSAVGPAASGMDDMLFDRLTDSAISVTGGKSFRMKYNWEAGQYDFTVLTGIKAGERKFYVSCKEGVLQKEYPIKNYAPVNKNAVFKKAPAGWMTWYAVGFDACEENVLENTKWQSEHLKKYGADSIWVDWEWYHKDYAGYREDGSDSFVPDPAKYPKGLKYVADKIKENGFTPAIWIGFQNDPAENTYARENPEIVLKAETSWSGTYFYDLSHPKYLNEFLPKALQQVKDWGYQAIKYDTLMDSLELNHKYYGQCYNPGKTLKETYRAMVQKTRECMGEECYMLCCGRVKPCAFWAADLWDATRVGGDLFDWDEFIENALVKTMEYYPLHNIVMYCDPDNVILSEQYNTYEQAKSRICFVSFLGLPMTFGDVFAELPEERVDLIRRCLPVMDIHPMDIKARRNDKCTQIINLAIEKPYESYNVINVMNLKHEGAAQEIRLLSDLYLDEGEYHLYDFMHNAYLGCCDTKILLEFAPHESRVIAVRKKLDRPQLLSTSRHVTQGAAEITDMYWSPETDTLHISADLVENDGYVITLFVPEGYEPADDQIKPTGEDGVYRYSFMPEASKNYRFSLRFRKV